MTQYQTLLTADLIKVIRGEGPAESKFEYLDLSNGIIRWHNCYYCISTFLSDTVSLIRYYHKHVKGFIGPNEMNLFSKNFLLYEKTKGSPCVLQSINLSSNMVCGIDFLNRGVSDNRGFGEAQSITHAQMHIDTQTYMHQIICASAAAAADINYFS